MKFNNFTLVSFEKNRNKNRSQDQPNFQPSSYYSISLAGGGLGKFSWNGAGLVQMNDSSTIRRMNTKKWAAASFCHENLLYVSMLPVGILLTSCPSGLHTRRLDGAAKAGGACLLARLAKRELHACQCQCNAVVRSNFLNWKSRSVI